jgi:hypothetical protein
MINISLKKKDRSLFGQVLRYSRGVDKILKTLAKLARRLLFSLAKSENNWPKNRKSQ